MDDDQLRIALANLAGTCANLVSAFEGAAQISPVFAGVAPAIAAAKVRLSAAQTILAELSGPQSQPPAMPTIDEIVAAVLAKLPSPASAATPLAAKPTA